MEPAPENIPSVIVLTLGNKVVLYTRYGKTDAGVSYFALAKRLTEGTYPENSHVMLCHIT